MLERMVGLARVRLEPAAEIGAGPGAAAVGVRVRPAQNHRDELRMRIPGDPITRSDAIRSPIPEHPISLLGVAELGLVMSVVFVVVKRGTGRPRHQWEGPARGAACLIHG